MRNIETSNETRETGIRPVSEPTPDCYCDGCGSSCEQVPAYGGAGDPLTGDFAGMKLVRRWRPMMWKMEPLEFLDWIIELQATRTLEEGRECVELYDSASSQIASSWECRDCAVLDDRAFLQRQARGGVAA